MKRLILIVSALMLSAASFAQTQVSEYQPGITEEGITYFLPQTYIRVVVTAKKVHHTPGEFCEYAQRYLRMNDVAQTTYDEWNIQNVEIASYGKADKSRAYTVKLKSKTSAPLVTLSTDGRLLAINTSAMNENELVQPSVVKDEADKKQVGNFKTQEILSAGSTAKMAELTANEIYDIRENRGLLSKGQADFMPKDGEQLRLMLANLDNQEDGLLQLFTGTETSETHTLVFNVLPTADVTKSQLFRFSKYLGVVEADDPAGIPIYIDVKDLKTVPEVAIDPKAKAKKEVEDVRYAVPSRVSIRVYSDEQEYASISFPMAQFGHVEHLGADLFNKKMSTRIQFYPETGGIAHVEGEEQ